MTYSLLSYVRSLVMFLQPIMRQFEDTGSVFLGSSWIANRDSSFLLFLIWKLNEVPERSSDCGLNLGGT